MASRDASSPIRMNPTGPVGQLRSVALLKGAQVVAGILFTVLVPRLMGPNLYGQFAVIISVFTLWRMSCTIGGRYIFGRFIPEYSSRGDSDRIREVFMHVLGARAIVVLVAAPLLFFFLRRVLPMASTTTLVASTLAFVVTMLAGPMYNVYFGLNRLGMSMTNDPIGRFLLLGLLVLIGGTSNLEMASVALLLANCCVLLVGLVLARGLITFDRRVFDLKSIVEHVSFGLVVYSANLLLRVPWRLGESALALAKTDSAEIAFFSVAVSATVAFTRLLGSATTLLIPSMSLRQASGDYEGRDRSMGIALRYLEVAACLFVPFVVAAGPKLVSVLLGDSYLGVVPHMYVLSIAVLGIPVLRTAVAFSVVVGRVGLNVQLGLVAVVVFGVAALALIPKYGAIGASVAVVASIMSSSIIGAMQIRKTGVLSEARVATQSMVAVASGAILLLGSFSLITAIGAAAAYVGISLALKVIQPRELQQLLRESGLAFWARKAVSP